MKRNIFQLMIILLLGGISLEESKAFEWSSSCIITPGVGSNTKLFTGQVWHRKDFSWAGRVFFLGRSGFTTPYVGDVTKLPSCAQLWRDQGNTTYTDPSNDTYGIYSEPIDFIVCEEDGFNKIFDGENFFTSTFGFGDNKGKIVNSSINGADSCDNAQSNFNKKYNRGSDPSSDDSAIEVPESNTIAIENTVDVLSSRQNTWLCDVAVQSTGQSDNRVYFTAQKFDKRGNSLLGPINTVIEAPVNGATVSVNTKLAELYSNEASGFGETEWRISNVRAELSSLNYGANIFVTYCMESPFAYVELGSVGTGYDYQGRDYRRWNIKAHSTFVDIQDKDSYFASSLMKTTKELTCGDQSSFSEADVTSNTSSAFTTDGFVNVNLGLNADTWASVNTYNPQKLCMLTMGIHETATSVQRLKGLTEGVRWKTYAESDYSIDSNASEQNN